ncbi:MAG: insulinase family protein [Acidobacteria bacterium]|nr:MAG: insulinase family protein [Acidobacteriota bacterium]REK02934.1 MAG: insulinase family protein [Acidobacteriota bacterium]REK13262.1 MAG: insulinase family protein [Acidobacteriota bacterium]REK41256.1 MAG: insulinase family protein [Acidobacteriota bacterium]
MLRRIAVLFSLAVLAFTSIVNAQGSNQLPKVNYTEYKLKNGMRVILHPDKSTPIVAVNVWYHVGSKNEVPGRTGFAHLFEHMMFQGSKNYNDDYFMPLQEAGANINGSTNPDRTNYYEVVPSNFLELALFMEADRMGGLLEAMTMEKLNNQRDVVKNERRQRYDNRPYGTAFEKISSLIYPADHPYHWTTIGSLEDLSNASMEDVQSFFRKYYAPNNASLVIAGDFDEKQARTWVEKYFAPIKGGSEIDRPTPDKPKIDGEIRKEYEDAVRLSRRYFVWHSVPYLSEDEPALDILAQIMSSGRGSRLQSSLVYDKKLAQSISASNSTREIGGTFSVIATARPNGSLEDIEKEIDSIITDIKQNGPSAEEVNRAKNAYEAGFIFGLQTVLGKADRMNSNATYAGKPDIFQDQLNDYLSVTPEDVQRVAKQYLTGNRLVMTFKPGNSQGAPERGAAENRPTSTSDDDEGEGEAEEKAKPKTDYSKNLPKAGPDPKVTLPTIEKGKLSNGLEVWMVRQEELPLVAMNLVIKTGGTANPEGKDGLASFTSGMLEAGTKNRSAVEISNELQSIGANIFAGADWDSTDVGMSTITKHLGKALDIYADVITNPSFPAEELDLQKRRALVGLLQRKDNPTAIAGVAFNKLLYGEGHPYGRSLVGTEESIREIKREDLVKFYETYYSPTNAVLIVVGDVDKKTLTPQLEKALAGWKSRKVPETAVPEAASFERPGIYIVDKPGAAQSEIRIGHPGVSRDNPDFIPILVMNNILGGQFSARVNMNLREDKGYTYGARTGFSFRRGAGPFTASAGVQTAVTKESVIEFMRELNGIRGSIPVSQDELDYSKQSLIRRFPRSIETNGQISGQLADLVVYDLSDDYVNDYLAKIGKVSLTDIKRVANKYLDPEQMAIVIVGDRSVIEPRLREIEGWGKAINYLDTEGNPANLAAKE